MKERVIEHRAQTRRVQVCMTKDAINQLDTLRGDVMTRSAAINKMALIASSMSSVEIIKEHHGAQCKEENGRTQLGLHLPFEVIQNIKKMPCSRSHFLEQMILNQKVVDRFIEELDE